MWRHALNDQFSYQRLPPRAAQSDSKSSIGEDYNTYLQYYSTDRPSFLLPYQFGKFRFLLAVLFTLLLLVFLVSTWRKGRHDFGAWDRDTHKQPHKRTKTLGGELHCDPEVMKPSPTVPSNVNKVRPADLKVIAALGDSITVASLSKDYEDDVTRDIYPGNSYIIGGDGTLEEQITVGKVLREFNPNLVGLSHGTGYNNTVFNVAVGGMTSEDMPRQARDLIKRMKKKGVCWTAVLLCWIPNVQNSAIIYWVGHPLPPLLILSETKQLLGFLSMKCFIVWDGPTCDSELQPLSGTLEIVRENNQDE
ncbi:hypothetical protein Y032_0258g454 [Ancylostoma ceylanicum]|uniref:Uncharacterized protein n=1 Tax=Ancylostoma ceylanicum TaxID=53326 RepID=A0A016SBQ9_9BILA|nr:hypothetical protein Y032_0258g454 [Ancylostoma ceylanicum]